jgi:hypothetical protein
MKIARIVYTDSDDVEFTQLPCLFDNTYTVNKGYRPIPSRDVTNQTLPGREFLNYSR